MSNDKSYHSYWLAALAFIASACVTTQGAGGANSETPGPNDEAATPVAEERSEDAPQEPAPPPIREAGRAVVHTTEGPITVTFFPDVAPRTVAHISALMAAGCYTGIELFRLEPGFVTQVSPVPDNGCHPDTASTVPAEFSDPASGVKHERLTLSLARWDEPDSGTSSWSIMLGAYPAMDGQYTVFGRVIGGEDAIKKIEAIGATMGENGMKKPKRAVTIERVEVLQPAVDKPGEPDPESTTTP